MKIVCTDGVVDCPLAADLFGLVENYLTDFPGETSIDVPFTTTRFGEYSRALVTPGIIVHDAELEAFMLAKVKVEDIERVGRSETFAVVSLECLEAAHAARDEWDASCTAAAARAGRLDCLRFAVENGCPMDRRCTENAAHNGHLECLRFARENGCMWTCYCTLLALCHGHIDCLRYAVENGCELPRGFLRSAEDSGHVKCIEYLREIKICPTCGMPPDQCTSMRYTT